MTKGKISYVQLAVMLILCRVFASAMNFPAEAAPYGMQHFTVIICAKILLCIMFLPLFFLAKKYNGKSFLTVTIEKSKVLGWVFGIIYALTLFSAAIISTVKFEYYTSSTIMSNASSLLLITLLVLVCIYGAYKGIEAMGRTGSIVLGIFIGFVLLMTISLSQKVNLNYIYGALLDNTDTFWREVMTELSRNSEVLLFAVLAEYVKENAHKAVYIYVIGSLIILLLSAFMTMTVLGPYMNKLSFPLYMLASMSDVVVFQRLDGIDVAVWVLTSIIKLTLYAIAFQTAARHLCGEKTAKFAPWIFLVITGLLGLYFSDNKEMIMQAKGFFNTGIPLIISGFVLPLVAYFIGRSKKHEKADLYSADN